MTKIEPQDPSVLHVLEEVATVSKEAVRTGEVRVRTVTDTIEEVVRASLQSEAVEVTRLKIDREVATPPTIRTEGDLTIIPVFEEVLFVEKRLVLKEEIHIRRIMATADTETSVALRQQRAVIERLDDTGVRQTAKRRRKSKDPHNGHS